MSDNLAVAHLATPSTQLPVASVGLRVMHRTIVRGVHTPDRAPPKRDACAIL